MTEYALAPSRKFTAETPYRTPRVMLEQGLLSAYRVRDNGTMRHLELYPLGSTARECAEWVSDRVDVDGASVQAVARELHVSLSTVRRYLEGLELTEEVEAGDWDGLSFDSAGNPIWDESWAASEDEAAYEPALKMEGGTDPKLPVTKDPVACNCAARIKTGTCEHVAPQPAPRTRRTRTPRTAQQVAESHGLPWPTDEEREAALAATRAEMAAREDQVPGAQCEPTGTTAEDLTPALEASVAQARRAALAVCFCGDQGVHAPGSEGCKNSPAIPRRTRSHS